MTKKVNPFIELLWLLTAAVITLLICGSSMGWDFTNTFDIHLADTYYIIEPLLVIIPLFLILSFVLFLVKENRYKFSRGLPAVIIFSTGILLIIFPAIPDALMPSLSAGWTLYPPLSGLATVDYHSDPVFTAYQVLKVIMQVIVMLSMLHVANRMGRNRRTAADQSI